MKISHFFITLFLAIALMLVTVSPVLAAAPTAAISYSVAGPYKSGILVTITATFSEDMRDSPVPQISISGANNLPASDMTKSSSTVYTYVYTVGAGNGTATISMSTGMNLNGDVVASAPTSGADFTVDNLAPTITINNPNTTPAQSKTISASTSDGTLTMSNTTGSTCDGTLAFVAYASQTFTSEADNGKKVCYKAVDTAGNIAYKISNAIAGIDTTAPTITITNPNTNPAQSKTITASASDGTLTMSNTTGSACDSTLIFVAYASQTFTSEADNGKRVCYKAVDIASNAAYSLSNAIAGIDATPPTITINNPTTAPAKTKTITASTSDGTLTMSNTTGSTCDGTLAFVAYASQTFSSEADNGKKVCYKAVDTAGNAAYSLSDAIAGIDTTPPTVTFDLQTTSDSGTSSTDNLTNATSPIIDAIFSETVTGLAPGDLFNTGTATGCAFFVGAPSGNTYPVLVTSCSAGTLILTLNAAGVTDAAGNANALTDGLTVTIDRTALTLSPVHIQSTNANPVWAKQGDTVTVSFTSLESIATPTVTIAGHAATIGLTGPTSWSASYVMAGTETEGILPFNISFSDLAGNTGIVVSTSTDGSTVTFVGSSPTLTTVHIQSNNTNPAWAKQGDTITLSFTSSKDIATPTVTIAGHAATIGLIGPTSWSVTYIMAVTDTEGIVAFNIAFSDLAGNPGIPVSTTTDTSSVTYDRTVPVFSAVAPVTNAFIKSITTLSAVSYTLSEAIASGSITMTRTGGTVDAGSPHICTLKGTALTIGVHNNLDLSDTTNSCAVAQALVSGTVYNFAFNGLDLVGNAALVVTSLNVTFDNTAPVFSAVAPATNAFIKSITTSSAVSYTLSEAITSGSITMTRTGGISDPGSPHVCTLIGTALTAGAHNHLDLSNTTTGCTVAQSLVSGAVYSFAFNGTDAVGFAATTVTSTNVTFDNVAPFFSAVAPATNALIGSITTSSAVSYTLNEAIASGSITMTRTGGTNDPGSPHICTLKGTALSGGIHSHLDLSNTTNSCTAAQSLVNGAIYTFAFNATDPVGFAAATVTSTNVSFDTVPPVFSAVAPASNAYIQSITTSSAVSYTLSKAVTSGSITMTWTGGVADSFSPHICMLTGTAMGSGAHNNLDLSDTTNSCTAAPSLVSGAVYTFAFDAIDAAGNAAATVTKVNVTFDNTPPVFSAVTPVSNDYINNVYSVSDIGYTLSEAIASGSITITRTGGAADTSSPHICALTGTALTAGVHTRMDLSDTTNVCTVGQTMVNGSIYTFAFNATDPVGFTAATVTSTNVYYDKTVPTLSWTAPTTDTQRYDVANQTVQLTVTASDNVGIKEVVFSRWDPIKLVRIEIGSDTTAPYSVSFNTSTLLPEYNEIDAKAYDLADNSSVKYIWLFHLPVLTVVRAGPGNGRVTSSPAGIDCGSTCFFGFNYDPDVTPPVIITVTLTATPISPSTFAGWSGHCDVISGNTCKVTMNAASTVTAIFDDPRKRIFLPLIIH